MTSYKKPIGGEHCACCLEFVMNDLRRKDTGLIKKPSVRMNFYNPSKMYAARSK